MIAIYCISHAPALLILDLRDYEGQGPLLLLYLMLVVQISDVLQYVFGKLFGKRKLAPTVSPSKTVEGLVGGGLAAVGIGTALWWITPFTPLQSALMSALIVVCGALGGLALSAVKRSLGAKDWGHMIEGHGGRSEEHTSELQSLMRISYAVFCLKKKKKRSRIIRRRRIKKLRIV